MSSAVCTFIYHSEYFFNTFYLIQINVHILVFVDCRSFLAVGLVLPLQQCNYNNVYGYKHKTCP